MGEKEILRPNEQEIEDLAEDLIMAQNTMTLATAKGNIAWAAPVYYVYLNSCFYFFSDPTARHIKESMTSHQASSAIYAAASTWHEIRGLQLSGRIDAIPPGLEAINVVRAYLKKFTFTKDFFAPGEDLDLGAFAVRFKVRLYRFKPSLIYYMDNSIRFGFRKRVYG